MSKATKWGLLFLILLFPSLLYIGLSTGKHNLFSLPYYGEYQLDQNGDTIYDALKLQEDIAAIWPELDTCNTVIAFIDQTNMELSSRIGTQLSSLAEKLSPMEDFRILLISDTDVSNEKALTQAFENSEEKWILLNLEGGLQELISKHFNWDTFPKNSVCYRLYLMDKQSYLRGVYNGDEYSKVKDLSDDIKALKADELIPKKDERNSSE